MTARLTPLDAGFLEAEDADRHVSLAIGGVAVLRGPAPDRASVEEWLTDRVGRNSRYTQRLRRYRLDLRTPEWTDDTDFDIRHHLRWVAAPAPGDDGALNELVADAMSRRLDRDIPLWEVTVIEGLREQRWALLLKVHHCVADGVSAIHLLSALADNATTESHVQVSTGALIGDVHRRSVVRAANPIGWPRALWHVCSATAQTVVHSASGGAGLVLGTIRPGASTSLNGSIGGQRRYAAARISMSDIDKICAAFDVTINDVALAAISASYRDVLLHRGEPPSARTLRALVPVSVRPHDADSEVDNRVSVMLPYLPIDIADPAEQLIEVHRRLRHAKRSGQREAGTEIIAAAAHLPFAISSWTVRLLTRLPQRGIAGLATNVSGPRDGLHLMNRDIIELLPVPPIAMRLRTGIAILSYTDSLFFGIIGDFDTAADVDQLAAGIEYAAARLVRAG